MNKYILAIALILLGAGLLLIWSGAIIYDYEMFCGFVLSAFGLANFNYAFRNRNKKFISLSAIVFLIGIILISKNYFEFYDERGLVFVSILFVSGAVFLTLFLDNPSQRSFLFAGIALIALSVASIIGLQKLGLFGWIKTASNLFEMFLPVILIVLGISVFINRQKL